MDMDIHFKIHVSAHCNCPQPVICNFDVLVVYNMYFTYLRHVIYVYAYCICISCFDLFCNFCPARSTRMCLCTFMKKFPRSREICDEIESTSFDQFFNIAKLARYCIRYEDYFIVRVNRRDMIPI